ncbi:hypothetical protein [Dapis sp. BLCC M172]
MSLTNKVFFKERLTTKKEFQDMIKAIYVITIQVQLNKNYDSTNSEYL